MDVKDDHCFTGFDGYQKVIDASDVVLIGLRNLDERERLLVKESGVTAYTMADVDRRGIATLPFGVGK